MKKHQQLPSEFQELLKNAKEVLLEQLKISKKQQNEDFQLNDLLKHLITQQDVEKLRQLFKHQTLWKLRIDGKVFFINQIHFLKIFQKGLNNLQIFLPIFQPLMQNYDKILTFKDHLVKEEQLQGIYDQFNSVRSQLFEILHTKQLQKAVNYISIMKELEKLEEQELNLDHELKYLKFNKLQNKDRYAINYEEYLEKIKNSKRQIDQWIKDNSQLSDKLKEISQKLQQNQQKQTTAMCLTNNCRRRRRQ